MIFAGYIVKIAGSFVAFWENSLAHCNSTVKRALYAQFVELKKVILLFMQMDHCQGPPSH